VIDSPGGGIQHDSYDEVLFDMRKVVQLPASRRWSARMKIGRQTHRASAICTSNEATVLVRGRDLCEELIGRISFTEHVWLLVTGELPSDAQRRVLDAVLVAIAEHGLVPSVQAGRMTLAAAPEALQGAVAAGLLGCGSVILGAAEDAGRLLHEVVTRAGSNESLQEAASEIVSEYRAAQRAIPGYGHPLHKGYDPRARRLLAIANEVGTRGRYSAAAEAIDAVLPEITGKPLAMNVSGAIPATLLDAGYPLLALKGVPLLARTASLIAHLLEERARPIGFVLSHAGAAAIDYDGPKPEGFQATDQ
jgi:citrate synthase